MNRRKFLKRAGQVLAGGMALTTKASPSASGCPSSPSISPSPPILPEYPLGTRKVVADGRVFRYCQVKKTGFIKKNDQIVGIGMGDGWMQTYGPCVVPIEAQSVVNGEKLVHLNISV